MPCLLIDDGFIFTFAIPASGPWPAVNGRYRPALALEVRKYLQAPRETPEQSLSADVALLADKLVSWDVTDKNGELVPIEKRILSRIPEVILQKMLSHVTGYGADQQEQDAKN